MTWFAVCNVMPDDALSINFIIRRQSDGSFVSGQADATADRNCRVGAAVQVYYGAMANDAHVVLVIRRILTVHLKMARSRGQSDTAAATCRDIAISTKGHAVMSCDEDLAIIARE
jgi:hypothetical protein